MNLDSLSFSLTQISSLVTNLTKKNYKTSQLEINNVITLLCLSIFFRRYKFILFKKLIESQGFEAERHFYRCLFSSIDFNSAEHSSTNNSKSNNTATTKDYHQIQLLKETLTTLFNKPNCISILNFAINNPLQYQEVIINPKAQTLIKCLIPLS